METVIVLCFILLLFGLYTSKLLNNIELLLEEQDMHREMIECMAKELHELGSPNVTITTNEQT